jgi:hypothetical protein
MCDLSHQLFNEGVTPDVYASEANRGEWVNGDAPDVARDSVAGQESSCLLT